MQQTMIDIQRDCISNPAWHAGSSKSQATREIPADLFMATPKAASPTAVAPSAPRTAPDKPAAPSAPAAAAPLGRAAGGLAPAPPSTAANLPLEIKVVCWDALVEMSTAIPDAWRPA